MHPLLSITYMTDCCLSELFRWWSVALMLSNTQISHSFPIHRSHILFFFTLFFLNKIRNYSESLVLFFVYRCVKLPLHDISISIMYL